MAYDLNKLRKQREAEKGQRDMARATIDLAFRMASTGDYRQVCTSIGVWLAGSEPEFIATFDPEMWAPDAMERFIEAATDVATVHDRLVFGTVAEDPEAGTIGFSLVRGEVASVPDAPADPQ